jgi:hypothetical protein
MGFSVQFVPFVATFECFGELTTEKAQEAQISAIHPGLQEATGRLLQSS